MKVTASVNDVAESVERMTGIPVSQMGATDIERLKDMAHRLEHKVIGQDKAVEALSLIHILAIFTSPCQYLVF